MKKCTRCERTYDDTIRFCTNCGMKLQTAAKNSHVCSEESVKAFIKELKSRYTFSCEVYFAGDGEKAESKIRMAITAYAVLTKGELPILCVDTTVFGGAEDGFVVTTQGIHIHEYLASYRFVSYPEMKYLILDGRHIVIQGEKVRLSNSKQERENILVLLQEIRQHFLMAQKTAVKTEQEAAADRVVRTPLRAMPVKRKASDSPLPKAKVHAPLLDLNQATESDLAELFFVNQILARRIIIEREKNGRFQSISNFAARIKVTKDALAEIREKCCVKDLPQPAAGARERNIGRIIDF